MERQVELIPIKIIIWRWSPNKAGLHPVRIRLSHKGQRQYYPVMFNNQKLYLSDSQFNLIQSKVSVRGINLKIQEGLNDSISTAREAVKRAQKNGRPFTWDGFEKEFLAPNSNDGFLSLWEKHLQNLRVEKRVGTHRTYKTALEAFKRFRKEIELSPFDITTELLKAFESFLRGQGCGKTTVAIYMRSLKVIYNLAIDENPSLLEFYPFARKQTDRKRYKIRTGSGHKGEALTIEQLQNFISIETEQSSQEREAQLLWIFSLRCQGMNMLDMFLLKYENINGNAIKYVRSKTKETESQEAIIEIPISDEIRSIIAEIGNPDKNVKSYVFSVIPDGLASTVKRRTDNVKTPEERIDEIVRQKIKMVNKRLRKICNDNNLPKMTTYWARHSYATFQKISGESIEFIRELLGHSSIATTENYLRRFDTERKRAANDKLNSILRAS